MNEINTTIDLTWAQVDKNQNIELAFYRGYKFPDTTPLLLTYKGFFRQLSTPEPGAYAKDGGSYMIGPCPERRSRVNLKRGYLAVIDADKSIVGGIETDGAPPPILVHQALAGWGICHCLHTTHSHGGEKGDRYRIILPAAIETPLELKAYAIYVTELLQTCANIPLALSRESYSWGSGWNYPRVPYEGASFEYYEHWGATPDLKQLVSIMGLDRSLETKLPKTLHEGPVAEDSPIGLIAKCMPIQDQLLEHGYKFVSQGVMADHNGEEVPVLRYRPPGSTSAPGVVVFKSEGKWKCYSHHTNDKLFNSHANDAFDVYRLLNGLPDEETAMLTVVPALQEFIEDELNAEYPSVLEGGTKFRFGNTYVDELGSYTYRMLDQAAFTATMRNRGGVPVVVTDDDGARRLKMKNRAEYWMACPRRVLYNDLLYKPVPILEEPELSVQKNGKQYFNLFRSWHLTPRRGSWGLLEWHLRNAICGGSEEEYNYLLNWLAHMFQKPNEKPGVALVLQGNRGAGKTIVLSELARKLGTHAFVAGNNRLLTGNFNVHLRNKLLLVVEESFWAGNHKEVGVLQHLVTDQLTGYEKKGFDAEAGLSYLRLALSSNNEWVTPAATDERRYFLPSVCTAAKDRDTVNGEKGNFFPALLAEMRTGGIEAFSYDLAHRPISGVSLQDVPQTEKLHEQKELSLDWIDKWLMNCLMAGSIRSAAEGIVTWGNACVVSHEQLQASLKESCPLSSAYSERGLITSFGIRTKKVFTEHQYRKVQRPEGMVYKFAGVVECREAFERYVNFPVDWSFEETPKLVGIPNNHGRICQ